MLLGLGTLPLESERLILRRFRREDARSAFANWCGDAQVTPYLKWRTHLHPEQTEQVLRYWVKEYASPYCYHWAMELKGTGEVIGGISLLVKDRADACGELGYSMGSRFWGQGLGSEAAAEVLRFGFERAGFHRIEGVCAVQNHASARLMQKLGMAHEGCMRGLCRLGSGEFADCDIYALLREEYCARQSTRLL